MSGSAGNRAPRQLTRSSDGAGAIAEGKTKGDNSFGDKITHVEDGSATVISTDSPVGIKSQTRPDLSYSVSPVMFPSVDKISGSKKSDSTNAMADARLPTDGDVRTWFKNLPTGEDRSEALAISDGTFMKRFYELTAATYCSDNVEDVPQAVGSTVASPRHGPGGEGTFEDNDMSSQAIGISANSSNKPCSPGSPDSSKGNVGLTSEPPPVVPPSNEDDSNDKQKSAMVGNSHADIGTDSPPGETLPSTAYRIRNDSERQGAVSGSDSKVTEKVEAAGSTPPRVVSPASTCKDSESSPGPNHKHSPRVVSPETTGSMNEREDHTKKGGKEAEADESAGTTTILHFESGLTIVLKAGKADLEEAGNTGGRKSSDNVSSGGAAKKEKGPSELNVATCANTGANTGDKAQKKRAKAMAVAESKRAAAQALKCTDQTAQASAPGKPVEDGDANAAFMDKVCLVFRSTLERCETNTINVNKKVDVGGNGDNVGGSKDNGGDPCKDGGKVDKGAVAIVTIDPTFLEGDGYEEFFQLASSILETERNKIQTETKKHTKVGATEYMSWKVPSYDAISRGNTQDWAHAKPDWWVSLFGNSNINKSTLSPAVVLLLGMDLAVRQSYLRSTAGKKAALVSEADAKKSMDIVISQMCGMKSASSAQVNMSSFVASSLNLPHPDGEEGSSTEQWATPPEEEGEHEEEENSEHDVLVGGKIIGSMTSPQPPAQITEAEPTQRGKKGMGIGLPTTCKTTEPMKHDSLDVNNSLCSLLELCRRLRKQHGMIDEAAEKDLMKEYIAHGASGQDIAGKTHLKRECPPKMENLLLTPMTWVQSSCSQMKNNSGGFDRVYRWASLWNNDILPTALDRLARVLTKHSDILVAETKKKIVESNGPSPIDHPMQGQATSTTVNTSNKQQAKTSEKDMAEKLTPSAENVAQSQGSSSKKKKRKNKKKKKKSSSSATDKSKQAPSAMKKDTDPVVGNKKVDITTAVSVGASEKGSEVSCSNKKASSASLGTIDASVASSSVENDKASTPKSKEPAVNSSTQPLPRTNSNITISRVDGVGATCVVVEQIGEKDHAPSHSTRKMGEENDDKHDDEVDGDGSAWEKVSTKSRGGRNRKSGGAAGSRAHGKVAQQSTTAISDKHAGTIPQSSVDSQHTRKSKGRSRASRLRVMHRKMARDIIFQVLDKVEDEAVRRRKIAAKAYEEERRKTNDERKRAAASRRIAALAEQKQRSASVPSSAAGGTSNAAGALSRNKGTSLRDVVVGGTGTSSAAAVVAAGAKKSVKQTFPKAPRIPEKSKVPLQAKKGLTPALVSSLVTGGAGGGAGSGAMQKSNEVRLNKDKKLLVSSSSVGQNTAPTVPETLSGVSAQTQSSNTDDEDTKLAGLRQKMTDDSEPSGVVDDTGSGSTEDVVGNDSKEVDPRQHTLAHLHHQSPSSPSTNEADGDDESGEQPPPLPTLLGPGNTNSASSSVASSLEAPHPTRYRTHCSSGSAKENDVGYHLLDVCDRLSNDMNIFMRRRASALSLRRRERGALLAALQDTVSSIWAGRCHVEMYGSCATQLDLPSSDLDVVICGLDHDNSMHQTSPNPSAKTHKHSKQKGGRGTRFSGEGDHQQQPCDPTSTPPSPHHHHGNHHHHHHHSHHQYPPLSPNASRVLRLSAELERQPWAVQVKAIPTASVPVIKILADPSLLPGAAAMAVAGNGDWMIHHQHMSAAAAATGIVPPHTTPPPPPPTSVTDQPSQAHNGFYAPNHPTQNMGLSPPPSAYHPPHTLPPWRGADIMNGLLSIDITFEGPEHGGVGSTAYSARVVQEACNETGLPPESTPAVQVTMVLKELLAQRRLNEPFSGGLSSYALLLLVVAVMKQWRAIREEMEQIERQRRAVATGGDGSSNSQARHAPVSVSGVTETVSTGESSEKKVVWPVPTPSSEQKNSSQPPSVPSSSSSSISISNLTEKASPEKPQQQPNKGRTEKQAVPTTGTAATTISKPSSSAAAKSSVKSSWASIARKKSNSSISTNTTPNRATPSGQKRSSTQKQTKAPLAATAEKESAKNAAASSTAGTDGVSRDVGLPQSSTKNRNIGGRQSTISETTRRSHVSSIKDSSKAKPESQSKRPDETHSVACTTGDNSTLPAARGGGNQPPGGIVCTDPSTSAAPSYFSLGSNDVLEVLCSGEPTAGKLLMHFLLFYGQYFDSQSTAIDVGGANHPEYNRYTHHQLSPFMPRRPGGTIDPVTGMFTVDPIVVYDPLEGAEGNNVARSCFAWSSIRWVFAQCYMTLSSAVERSGSSRDRTSSRSRSGGEPPTSRNADSTVDDPSQETVEGMSPILELLLSF